jgi:hypothetical protein
MNPLMALGLVGGGLIGKLFNRAPEYGMRREDIDKLISSYRRAGLAGLSQLGQQEMGNMSARLASVGVAQSPGTMQAAYTPILERLAGGRAQLEGNLAGTEAGMLQNMYNQQFQAQMYPWQDRNQLLASLMDLGGIGLLSGMGGGLVGGAAGGVPMDMGAVLGGGDLEGTNDILPIDLER